MFLKMQFSFGWEGGEEIDEFQTLGQTLLIGLTNGENQGGRGTR